jgi:hypothetical protein
VPGYAPLVAYVDQFDNLVREQDRGHAIRHTRTIAVFDDGLAVCAVPVSGGSPALQAGLVSRLFLGGRVAGQSARSSEHIRDIALAMGAGGTAPAFAQSWPHATAIPFAVVVRIELSRSRQVSRLAVEEEAAHHGQLERTVYLGDLSAHRVREVLAPLIGDRLAMEVGG